MYAVCNIEQKDKKKKKSKQKNLMDGESRRHCVVIIILLLCIYYIYWDIGIYLYVLFRTCQLPRYYVCIIHADSHACWYI